MVTALSLRLVPDRLWEVVEPLIPRFARRAQGGGTAPVDDRAVFSAIVYVLTSGCPWRQLPVEFGVDFRTAHRRFKQWTRQGLWPEIQSAVLAELQLDDDIDWSLTIVGAAAGRSVGVPH